MQVFSNKLLAQLEDLINFTERENDIILRRSEQCFNICKKVIEQLKEFALKYKFKSQPEEIKFFKEIKPLFTSKLIYHLTIYNIETKKPNGGKEILRNYFSGELVKLKHYFDYNLDFYKYYRAGANYLDHKYFVRDKYDIQLALDGYVFENDNRFCTTHDFKVAKILAHDRLQVFLESQLLALDNKDVPENSHIVPKFKLTCTDSKTSLIELIYAVHASGCFDNGKADVKEIAACFEQISNIELGEYYRTYLEIRLRKTGRTKFLNLLTERLLKKMDEADEK